MWYAVIESDTGRLLSTGTVLERHNFPEAGVDVVELGDDHTADGKVWDEAARAFVPAPPPPVVPELVWNPDARMFLPREAGA